MSIGGYILKGLFITLEGPDGSGKTTILDIVKKKLEEKNIDVITTREPGGTKIGEDIRDIILSNDNVALADETEALLYAASRAQHVSQVIRPAIEDGKIVISDRFLLSSLAYQGVGRELGIEEVKMVNDFGTKGLQPDMILFFDIDPEDTLKRKTADEAGDRLENEGNTFHRKVYDGYKELIDKYPENIKIINARESIEKVSNQVLDSIEDLIDERRA